MKAKAVKDLLFENISPKEDPYSERPIPWDSEIGLIMDHPDLTDPGKKILNDFINKYVMRQLSPVDFYEACNSLVEISRTRNIIKMTDDPLLNFINQNAGNSIISLALFNLILNKNSSALENDAYSKGIELMKGIFLSV